MRASPRRRAPIPPGQILQAELLTPLGMTLKQLAAHLGCEVKVIHRIVNGHTAATASMAPSLGALLGTSPGFWLNAQRAVDLHRAAQEIRELPPPIRKASGGPALQA